MKFLVIGLGSMGKRRVRCLQALGYQNIIGFDPRKDRCQEAQQTYGISTRSTLETAPPDAYDAWVISTPPDRHNEYLSKAVDAGVPAFVEASAILKGLAEIKIRAAENDVLIAPSCTVRFHPLVKDIKQLVKGGTYGRVTNFSYHFGQYLPDWHPWEKVTDFYASKKATGACRELVPFELTWLTDIVGLPEQIIGLSGQTMDVGADIEDTYAIALKFPKSFGTLVVDIVSRYALRHLLLNLEYGQILWRWDKPYVKVYDARQNRWITYEQQVARAHRGYNENISEQMYIEEIETFIQAVDGKRPFPNTLDDDIKMLEILYQIIDSQKEKHL